MKAAVKLRSTLGTPKQKEPQFFSNNNDMKLALGWGFLYHQLPPIKTAPLPLCTKIFTVHKGIFFCCFVLVQRVEQHLSFRKGKGGTSGLGGSHHWRGTHGKIKRIEKVSSATATCRAGKHTHLRNQIVKFLRLIMAFWAKLASGIFWLVKTQLCSSQEELLSPYHLVLP